YVGDGDRVHRLFDVDAWTAGANRFGDVFIGSGQVLGAHPDLTPGRTLAADSVTIADRCSLGVYGGSLTTAYVASGSLSLGIDPPGGVALTLAGEGNFTTSAWINGDGSIRITN